MTQWTISETGIGYSELEQETAAIPTKSFQ